MDKFSQLIIEAYRNPNFRFAEESSPAPEPEIIAPTALDYPGLFARMQSLEDDKKLSIYMNLKRAQTKLKLKYNIDSQLPIKLDSTKSPAEYSDNSNSNTDEKIQTYFYRVFEYLVNYFKDEASSAATSDPTSSSVSEESSSAVITDPSTDSSSGETSATTETTPTGSPSKALEGASESSSPANLKPTITIEVSGEEYQSPKVLKFQDNINIGRNLSNDIILKDPRISFDQASIFLDNEQWFIKDNDSANGSFINDINTRIKEPVILKKDDQIRFSTYYIKVISIDSEELNEFGNPVNNSGVGFFDNDESSTPTGGGGFSGRRSSF